MQPSDSNQNQAAADSQTPQPIEQSPVQPQQQSTTPQSHPPSTAAPNPQTSAPHQQDNGKAIAALILAALSFVFPLLALISLPMALRARKEGQSHGVVTAAMILSLIAVIILAFIAIALILPLLLGAF